MVIKAKELDFHNGNVFVFDFGTDGEYNALMHLFDRMPSECTSGRGNKGYLQSLKEIKEKIKSRYAKTQSGKEKAYSVSLTNDEMATLQECMLYLSYDMILNHKLQMKP